MEPRSFGGHGGRCAMARVCGLAGLVVLCLGARDIQAGRRHPGRRTNACSRTARLTLLSCRHEAIARYWLDQARCENDTSPIGAGCQSVALNALRDALEECEEQFGARLDVCEELGQAPYDPPVDPENFTSTIDNPFLPLVPGTTRIYEAETEDGVEVIEVTVTGETREILGVTCVVVRDTVTLDDELIEDTWDWFAQDLAGNVWYFGEHSREYEDGELVGLEGSWEAGVDGARPGIVMPAEPEVGDFYRQEYLIGEAEDVAGVVALDQTVTVPAGTFNGCAQTEDLTPIEPDVLEAKYYAPGVGVVLEVNLVDGERVELIEVITEP